MGTAQPFVFLQIDRFGVGRVDNLREPLSPLHLCAWLGFDDIASMLLGQRVKADAEDSEGLTPLV